MTDYCVYILASGRDGTLYVGVTNDLARRLSEHKSKVIPGFTRRYGVDRLVWYEVHSDVDAAIAREKQIKGWNRAWWRSTGNDSEGDDVQPSPAAAFALATTASNIGVVSTPVLVL